MNKFTSLKSVIKDHEISLVKKSHEQVKGIIDLVVNNKAVLMAIKEKINEPIHLDEYLNYLLDNGKIIQYELAKELIEVYL